jgi:ferredoxin
MRKLKIEYERDACIGAAVCAALDEVDFEMNADGKADLLGGKDESGTWVKDVEFDEEQTKKLLECAEGCPVNIIHVTDKETGKKLI